ncbi:hypothetical protein H7H51_07675 [Mycolicibacterium farcinogenes]|nr:hypothetical protein [Mycolicibacterium farcinogenes]
MNVAEHIESAKTAIARGHAQDATAHALIAIAEQGQPVEVVLDHNDLADPPVPELPIGRTRAEKPDAAAFIHAWALCPCCGKRMWIMFRAANNLLVAEANHQ